MKTVKVRNLTIGEGMPKICVPIVESTEENILAEAEKIKTLPADIVEWRMDWYAQATDEQAVIKTAEKLRNILGEMPLLATFRTAKEGGEKEILKADYEKLNLAVINSGYADLIDVEAFIGEDTVKRLIVAAHQAGVKVVASNHDFTKTPPKEEIIKRLRQMQSYDADIPKIAVMPEKKADVLSLLEATTEMHEQYADRPIITMSMSHDGMISRICGELTGSALTFGAAGKTSAPGQLDVHELKQILSVLHR